MDYFFTKNISLALDFRLLSGNIDSEWDYNNGNSDDFKFMVTNIQGLLGLRVWF